MSGPLQTRIQRVKVSPMIVAADVADRVRCGAWFRERPRRKAGCMPENDLPIDRGCGRRGPTAFDPGLK
jgi:hypothetical protein